MLYCCDKCHKWHECIRKWILGQKNLPQTCCVECGEFSNCLNTNRLNRWNIVHGENFVNSKSEVRPESSSGSGFATIELQTLMSPEGQGGEQKE